MAEPDPQEQPTPTQPTQPKGVDPMTGKPYQPVEIPVPKRSTWDRLVHHAESTPPPKGQER